MDKHLNSVEVSPRIRTVEYFDFSDVGVTNAFLSV